MAVTKHEPSTKLEALLACKCPRCRKGQVFTHSALNFRRFDAMHKACPVCGLYYEIEVGFFWGATYMSYSSLVGVLLLWVV